MVTADAMHCQKAHADYLVLQRGAHYILTVKGNQPTLRNQLKALPWKDVPVSHTSTDRGHGRVEKRTLKVVAVSTGILFPHAVQAIQITRKTRKLGSKKWRTEVVYAVTSLAAAQATDAQLAAFIRGHWCVENREGLEADGSEDDVVDAIMVSPVSAGHDAPVLDVSGIRTLTVR